MLSWYIGRKIDAFEREFSYDMDYARELLDTSVKAMVLLHRVTGLRDFREGVPKDAWYAAELVATRSEDCGPCLQLIVTMAERDGQSSEMIRGVLSGQREALSNDVQLSVDFTRAVLARDPAMSTLRRQVVERFGRRGLVSLAFAILSSRFYPTLKYALGYGHACSVVQVGGDRLTARELK